MREQSERILSIIFAPYQINPLLGSYPLSSEDDARQPYSLAKRSISECQWVTVGKLAALRILNDQNTHPSQRARAREHNRNSVGSQPITAANFDSAIKRDVHRFVRKIPRIIISAAAAFSSRKERIIERRDYRRQ